MRLRFVGGEVPLARLGLLKGFILLNAFLLVLVILMFVYYRLSRL